jgi:uncharacterized membrane protein affecting hemolysin expression
MLLAYSILSVRVDHIKHSIKKSGIKLTNEFADLVSLPLLERDTQSIHRLLTKAASQSGVFYASVVDHRNEVVAYTGTGHLMPDMTSTNRSVEKVSIQEGGFAVHDRIVNFVSDISYGGTKIGEMFIGFSTPRTIQVRKLFMIIAIISGLFLLVLIILFRYASIKTRVSKILDSGPLVDKIKVTDAKAAPVVCPLCGNHHQLSATIFESSNVDQFLDSGAATRSSEMSTVADNPAMDKQSLEIPEDLSWLKRRIIMRCTEIIQKLTA